MSRLNGNFSTHGYPPLYTIRHIVRRCHEVPSEQCDVLWIEGRGDVTSSLMEKGVFYVRYTSPLGNGETQSILIRVSYGECLETPCLVILFMVFF